MFDDLCENEKWNIPIYSVALNKSWISWFILQKRMIIPEKELINIKMTTKPTLRDIPHLTFLVVRYIAIRLHQKL